MTMINNCTFMGRLTADIELRRTQTGVDVTSFEIAVDRKYVAADGNRTTDFIPCVAWKKTAEFLSKYFHKGDMVGLIGSMQTRTYDDKNGNKRKAIELIVEDVSFCGNKSDAQKVTTSNSFSTPSSNDFEEIGGDDDVPF